jgi:hypothetical protein
MRSGSNDELADRTLPLVKRIFTAPLLVILSVLVLVPVTFGQQDQTEGGRKIVSRATPHYPEIARRR